MTALMRLHAFAKLNLSLEVLGVRPDGYHDIRSLVQTIDLADHLVISASRRVRVTCSESLEGINLVETAVKALLAKKASNEGIRIHIDKNIPIGGGLGGGSSDAAATLWAVNRLLPPILPVAEIVGLAAQLGADVPLFLTGGCLTVSGTGTPDRRLPVRDESYVIVAPSVRCSTEQVYKAWRKSDPSQSDASELGRNDLYDGAARLFPGLQDVRQMVSRLGADYFGMSGSGACFFAAFADHTRAQEIAAVLRGQIRKGRVYYARSIDRGFAVKGGAHEDRD